MYLAVKTTASPAETWAIVIVAVICLAFWLVMVVGIAPRPDARKRQGRQAWPVPFAGGTPVPAMATPGASAAQDTEAPGADTQGTEETRDDLPTVPGQRQPAPLSPTRMPAQRESATDEAAPSQRPGR